MTTSRGGRARMNLASHRGDGMPSSRRSSVNLNKSAQSCGVGRLRRGLVGIPWVCPKPRDAQKKIPVGHVVVNWIPGPAQRAHRQRMERWHPFLVLGSGRKEQEVAPAVVCQAAQACVNVGKCAFGDRCLRHCGCSVEPMWGAQQMQIRSMWSAGGGSGMRVCTVVRYRRRIWSAQ